MKRERIVIAGGHEQAEYIISMFGSQKKDLIVINPDDAFASELTARYSIPVFVGQSYRRFVLEESNIDGADILIALDTRDENNFVTCMLAKQVYNVKKCICIVNNPDNVEVFKDLGIDSVISSTHLLAESIKNESNISDVINTLSLEHGMINIVEITIGNLDFISNKKIMEIGFPKVANIACVYRKPQVIIPNGQTVLRANDKVTIVCQSKDVDKMRKYIRTGVFEY